jgi:NAD(P)H-hydrate epimerase
MALIDRAAQDDFGIPGIVLMENAASSAWRSVSRDIDRSQSLVFVGGSGNNGGDAFAMARHALLDGVAGPAIVLASSAPREGTSPDINLKAASRLGIEIAEASSGRARTLVGQSAWVFDGISGTGLRGALRAPLDRVVELVNGSAGRRVAIDVPSGVRDRYVRGDPAVRADITITMGLPKTCLYQPSARALCGEIRHASPGFPPELLGAEDIPGDLLDDRLPEQTLGRLPGDTYKTRRGHLGVFAGSRGTTGAAWLAAHAAARSRAGLVTVHLDREVYDAVAGSYSSVMVRPGGVEQGLERYGAFLAGPGWGTDDRRQKELEALLGSGLPGVLDADAITLLSRMNPGHVALGGGIVLTPHPGELGRLAGIDAHVAADDPLPRALELSSSLGCMIVVKGHVTYVVSPDGRFGIWDGMNAALATAGSGDVLAGVIAGLLAAGETAETAARCAVVVHGVAGRHAAAELGCLLAQDLLPRVSQLLGPGVGR